METPVRLTRHAKNRLRLWETQEVQVLHAVHHPEVVTEARSGRFNAWARTGAHWLRVTYVTEQTGHVVITVTRRLRGPKET